MLIWMLSTNERGNLSERTVAGARPTGKGRECGDSVEPIPSNILNQAKVCVES